LLAFFFSIIVYDLYINRPVITTKIGLYFVRLAKYALPTVPRPRDASISPPLQQSEAAIAVKIEDTLKNFSFINNLLNTLWGFIKLYHKSLLKTKTCFVSVVRIIHLIVSFPLKVVNV